MGDSGEKPQEQPARTPDAVDLPAAVDPPQTTEAVAKVSSRDDRSSAAPASAEEILIAYVEREARASLGDAHGDTTDRAVAELVVERVEEIANRSPPEQATRLRSAIAERAYGLEIDDDGEPRHRARSEPDIGATDGSSGRERQETAALRARGERELEQLEREAPERPAHHRAASANSIEAPDGRESEQAERQLADLIELVADQSGVAKTTESTGFFGRLRGLVGRSASERTPSAGEREIASEDPLPEVLRRRYGVHVSDDQKRIDLFEAGAKTAAISIDARSISTRQNEGAVIADIALLAKDRGWQSLRVAGTAEFKDAMWVEASKIGLTLDHQPSPAARAALDRWDRERPANRVELAVVQRPETGATPPRDDLGALFVGKSAEERLADPRFRNAQLELMVGLRTAEKELGRPVAEIPDVARAMAAVVGQQLAGGKVFEAPFARPEKGRPIARQIVNPRIEADRIPPPRP